MKRQLVRDTDNGKNLQIRINELKALIKAYRIAQIREKR